METKVICVDVATFDQWQSIGLVEGLSSDLDIASFLIRMYDMNKEGRTQTAHCPTCHSPVSPLCDTCRSSQPPADQPQAKIRIMTPENDQSQSSLCRLLPGNNQSRSGSCLSRFKGSQSQSGTNCSNCGNSQSGTIMSHDYDNSQLRTKVTFYENSRARLETGQSCPETSQFQPLTSISHTKNGRFQSGTVQTQAENIQSQPGTSRPYSASFQSNPNILQSQTVISKSPSGTSQAYSAGVQSNSGIRQSEEISQSEPGISRSYSASIQSRLDITQRETEINQTEISRSEPGTSQPCLASVQSHPGVVQRDTEMDQSEALLADGVSPQEQSQHSHPDNSDRCGVAVKEEGDDDDDTRDAPYVETAVPSLDTDSPAVKQESASFPDSPPSPHRGEKMKWGPMESKALSWFLDRYELYSLSAWDDLALILNAALHTSATGEDYRKLAQQKNLITPKPTRRTRSSGTVSLHMDPKGSKQTISNGLTEPERPRRTQSNGMTVGSKLQGPRQTRSSVATSLNSESDRPRKKRSCDTSACDTETEASRRTTSSGGLACDTEPQGPRKPRPGVRNSKSVTSNEKKPQGSRRKGFYAQKVANMKTVRTSQRPGLRSSAQSALMQVVPDPDDPDNATFTHPAPLSDDEEEKKEDVDITTDKKDDVAVTLEKRESVAMTLCDPLPMKQEVEDGTLPTTEGRVDAQQVAPVCDTREPDTLLSSQIHVEVSGDSHLPKTSTGSRLSWHYLGVADVDLPDVGQKRKSFKHSPNDRYQCKECSSSFTHRGILVKHIRLAHLKWRPYRCDFCSAAYATKTKLQRHVNVAHTKVRPFCCETCGASFVDHYTLLCHKDTHKEDRQYRFFCELCGKGYYGMRELKRHMETHSSRPTKSLLCWVCGKAVRTTQYLRIHLRTHSPEKAFTCTDCGHIFTSKCALAKHKTSLACRKRLDRKKSLCEGREEEMKKKHAVTLAHKRRERKPGSFQCDICHKYFSAKKNIYKHKRSVHGIEVKRETDDRIVLTDPAEIARYFTPKKRDSSLLKHACDVCSKRYSSQESLRKHKNIVHFGRRDYTCDLCDKTFTRHTSVIEHKHNVHNPAGKSGRQTAQCDICQKTFAAKNSLRKHLKTVHFGLLPYGCVDCGKKFASKYHLREHHKTSGHGRVTQEEDNGSEPSSKGVDDFHHAVSTPAPAGQLTDTCGSVASMTGLVTSCLSSLHPINPWASLAPSSGTVTAIERVAGVNGRQQELSADGSVVMRTLPSVTLWNMG